ncbi:DUF998 domain-containing protein [uncultured Cellulomonas sp.]|uniref:DUF998 domain-containing protein n=1 Tax=uncultured Cellulomonas sp. TaxID=189682 RepID=UPI0028ED9F4B|nr:DUF998 domain-containing protein [uncultured Cellulomonas sp.]
MPVNETSRRPAAPAVDPTTAAGVRRARAARTAVVSGSAALVLTALLHVLKPEVSIRWQTTSEYAVGRHGWVMTIAFLLSGLACGALAVAVADPLRRRAGRIAVALLVLASIGTCVGAIFVTDPIDTPQSELSSSGTLHGLGAGLSLVLLPVAALLLNRDLARSSAGRQRTLLLVSGALPLVALVVFMVAQAVLTSRNGGTLGPGAPIGGVERLLVLAYAAWQIVTARLTGPPAGARYTR